MSKRIDGKIQNDLLQPVGIAIDFYVINFGVERELDPRLFG